MPCFCPNLHRFFGRCLVDKADALVYHHYKISYQKGFEGNRLILVAA